MFQFIYYGEDISWDYRVKEDVMCVRMGHIVSEMFVRL